MSIAPTKQPGPRFRCDAVLSLLKSHVDRPTRQVKVHVPPRPSYNILATRYLQPSACQDLTWEDSPSSPYLIPRRQRREGLSIQDGSLWVSREVEHISPYITCPVAASGIPVTQRSLRIRLDQDITHNQLRQSFLQGRSLGQARAQWRPMSPSLDCNESCRGCVEQPIRPNPAQIRVPLLQPWSLPGRHSARRRRRPTLFYKHGQRLQWSSLWRLLLLCDRRWLSAQPDWASCDATPGYNRLSNLPRRNVVL